MSYYELGEPDRVSVGTVGPLGQRIFLLQAREGGTLVTLKLEKQQVGALAQHLGQLLQDLARPGEIPDDLTLTLEEPLDPAFSVGTLAVAYDAIGDRVIVLAEERVEEETEGEEARFALTREQAAGLAIQGTRLVEAGRPPCPLCGFPLDPRGHACPRTNGHRAPLT
ncbi:MAG: hypothetical protein JWM85_257 [Acidimicrobiaceae bacterium]|nr:hypothetical protein [Acidimicrobiaceae bacterium]